MIRGILLIVLLIVAVLVGLVAWMSPAPKGLPLVSPTPVPGKKPVDVQLSVSERRMAQQMAESLRDNPNVKDPVFKLVPPDSAQVTVTLSTQILGQTLEVRPTVEMQFVVVDGLVQVRARSMDVNGVPVPSWAADVPMRQFTQPIEEQINAAVRQVSSGSQLQLTSIDVTDDLLIMNFS